jgi:hypothetical protein
LCEIATTYGRAIEAEFAALKKTMKTKKKAHNEGTAAQQVLQQGSEQVQQ